VTLNVNNDDVDIAHIFVEFIARRCLYICRN